MPLTPQITQSLARWKGLDALVDPAIAVTETWELPGVISVATRFVAVDTLGCAIHEIVATVPVLNSAPVATLENLVRGLCGRVTYLLEPIGPIEIDAQAATVLARSVPPAKEPGRTSYYEIVAATPGIVTLRRFLRAEGSDDREQVAMHLTHEVLKRLVHDLVESIPGAATA
jgi:hypothetical protein